MIKLPFLLKTFFWTLLAISSALPASQGSCGEITQETFFSCVSRPLVEVKTGYFFFSDSKMRKVYNRGGWDTQLGVSYPLRSLAKWTFHAYGALEYFRRSGKSIHGNQKTSLRLIPFHIGLKPVYKINAHRRCYFAIGPRYFSILQRNSSSYTYKNRSKNGLGFFVNTGFNCLLDNRLIIDVFGEYSYAKIRFHQGKSGVYTRNTQVGGFTFGGGMGRSF